MNRECQCCDQRLGYRLDIEFNLCGILLVIRCSGSLLHFHGCRLIAEQASCVITIIIKIFVESHAGYTITVRIIKLTLCRCTYKIILGQNPVACNGFPKHSGTCRCCPICFRKHSVTILYYILSVFDFDII